MFLALLLGCQPSIRCGVDAPCVLDEGEYWQREAVGQEAGTMVFLHGWGGDAQRWADRLSVFSDAGLRVLVPQAIDGRWNVAAWDSAGRDESAFLNAVLDDARVGRRPLFLAGYSVGASVVYERACADGDRFSAFAAMSGSFWLPLPESCVSGPINLRHLHGEADTTFPLAGRAMSGAGQMGPVGQGNTNDGLDLIRAHDRCVGPPERIVEPSGQVCERWRCEGSEVRRCLHPGGHSLPSGWERGVRDWFLDLR